MNSLMGSETSRIIKWPQSALLSLSLGKVSLMYAGFKGAHSDELCEDNKATWPIAVSWTRSAVGEKFRFKKRPTLDAHLLYTRSVGHKILLTAS